MVNFRDVNMREKIKVKNFCLPNQHNENICLEDLKGKWVVLYFYPRDNSKSCTIEAQNFTDKLNNIINLGAEVIGLSPDSVKSHQKFATKHNIKFTLLSDPKHIVLEQFGVWQKKKMYGKEYMGVIRSTFIINPKGNIISEWRKVRVKGHVEEVLSKLKELIN
jgi:peroxiredoxin Q/BCP